MADPGLGDDLARAPFGVGSSAETANAPSGLGQVAGGLGSVAGFLYNSLGELAKKAIQGSQADTADYAQFGVGAGNTGRTIGPALETAIGTVGAPLVGPAKAAGEVILGSGAIRRAPHAAADTPGVIPAYHSSPHDFEQFKDVGRIGEGARAYGEGGYFAASPEVSGQGGRYWDQFLSKFSGTEREAARALQKAEFDRAKAIDTTQWHLRGSNSAAMQSDLPQSALDFYKSRIPAYEEQLKLLQSGQPVGPRTYEVGIRADPNDMLQWHKTIEQQPQIWDRISPDVKGAIDDLYDQRGFNVMSDVPEEYTGRELFKALHHYDVTEAFPNFPGSYATEGLAKPGAHVAAYLESLGIPGVKYLDEVSRSLPSASQYRVGQSNLDPNRGLFSRGDQGWYVTPQPGVVSGKQYGPFATEAEAIAHRATEPWKTNNYVVFPGQLDKVDIFKKYAVPAAPGLGAGLAASMMSQPSPPEQRT